MYVRLLTVCYYLLCVCLMSCSNQAHYEGEINATLIERLNQTPHNSTLVLTSSGGKPDYGLRAAHLISDNQLHIKIDEFCLSSCAEYILPSASSLTFLNNPIIGFHQNPVMIEAFRDVYTGSTQPICFYADSVKATEEFYNKQLKNPRAWQITLKILNLREIQYDVKDDCVQIGFRFENILWLPTSHQLRDIWGLDFTGTLCADDYMKCRQKIDYYLPKDDRVIMGNDLYISQGP